MLDSSCQSLARNAEHKFQNELESVCWFFLLRAPWSALAAVGGASGEKTTSLVRTNGRLCRAKVKPLRTQIRQSAM